MCSRTKIYLQPHHTIYNLPVPTPPASRTPQAALLAGALTSAALTLYVGRHNPSHLLITLFLLWILVPFAALFVAQTKSPRWTSLTRTTLSALSILIPIVSVAIYAYTAFGPSMRTPAAPFLMAPLASLLLTAIALATATLISRK